MSSELKSFEQVRQDMRKIGILGYINEGARQMLLRLIEMKMLSTDIPKLETDKKSDKKEQTLIDNQIIKQCLEDVRFMDGILLGEAIVPQWSTYTEKNKTYRAVKWYLKSDTRTITVFEEVKDEL